LAALLERGGLLELLPAALEQRLRARALVPALQPRAELERVAELRSRLLVHAVMDAGGEVATEREPLPADADVQALRERLTVVDQAAEARRLEANALRAAMERHFLQHPVHRAGTAVARMVLAGPTRGPLARLRRLLGRVLGMR
jgi:hypothetical protein